MNNKKLLELIEQSGHEAEISGDKVLANVDGFDVFFLLEDDALNVQVALAIENEIVNQAEYAVAALNKNSLVSPFSFAFFGTEDGLDEGNGYHALVDSIYIKDVDLDTISYLFVSIRRALEIAVQLLRIGTDRKTLEEKASQINYRVKRFKQSGASSEEVVDFASYLIEFYFLAEVLFFDVINSEVGFTTEYEEMMNYANDESEAIAEVQSGDDFSVLQTEEIVQDSVSDSIFDSEPERVYSSPSYSSYGSTDSGGFDSGDSFDSGGSDD